jgi:uncharacterized membrane protein YqjE
VSDGPDTKAGESAPEAAPEAETPPTGTPAAGAGAGAAGTGDGRRADQASVGELVAEVSQRASLLIREEVELAKAEVNEKVNRLLRGSVVGLVGGIFALLALILIMHGVAWVLNDLVFDNFWLGFFVEAGLFLLIGAVAGLYAYRAFKKGAPPTPDMAIEEAKEIKASFDGGEAERRRNEPSHTG